MKNKLVIREKYWKHWPAATIISLILSVTFFITYQLIENVLWTGYLRLAAFSFFAISLLSFFKVKDGQVEITVTANDESVESVYKVRDKVIFSNKLPISDLYELKTDQLPNKSLYNDFMKSDKCVRFRKKNDSAWYYFNEIESRVIPLTKENAGTLCNFLKSLSSNS